jgi:transposase InsO family protein
MIMDVFSRMIVGWDVHESERGEEAAHLLERTVWREKCTQSDVVLHSDNGSPMKSLTMQAKMRALGVEGSRGRPGVSNDNPYSELLFRTLKYCPRWPSEGFKTLEDARSWVKDFTHWYNKEYRHSSISLLHPNNGILV